MMDQSFRKLAIRGGRSRYHVNAQAKRGPSVLELPQGGRAGLALCHQITTLDRAKLSKRIGVLAPDQMEKLDEAIKTALDLD
jgi:mRNA-degrading endonuclease toxin of MazEF toxin-antitoxin module